MFCVFLFYSRGFMGKVLLGADPLGLLMLSPGGTEHVQPALWLLIDAAGPRARLGLLGVLVQAPAAGRAEVVAIGRRVLALRLCKDMRRPAHVLVGEAAGHAHRIID